MTNQQRLKRLLLSTRERSERMLADFRTPAQWTHQVHPGANHAMWFAGHMASTDNFLTSIVAPQSAVTLDWLSQQFGMGSQPSPSAGDYRSPDEMLALMRDRRAALLAALDTFTDETLGQKTPPKSPDFLPDFASVFETAVWHENLHAGQLTVARKALGFPPIMS